MSRRIATDWSAETRKSVSILKMVIRAYMKKKDNWYFAKATLTVYQAVYQYLSNDNIGKVV
jgi:hypothetical protein